MQGRGRQTLLAASLVFSGPSRTKSHASPFPPGKQQLLPMAGLFNTSDLPNERFLAVSYVSSYTFDRMGLIRGQSIDLACEGECVK